MYNLLRLGLYGGWAQLPLRWGLQGKCMESPEKSCMRVGCKPFRWGLYMGCVQLCVRWRFHDGFVQPHWEGKGQELHGIPLRCRLYVCCPAWGLCRTPLRWGFIGVCNSLWNRDALVGTQPRLKWDYTTVTRNPL